MKPIMAAILAGAFCATPAMAEPLLFRYVIASQSSSYATRGDCSRLQIYSIAFNAGTPESASSAVCLDAQGVVRDISYVSRRTKHAPRSIGQATLRDNGYVALHSADGATKIYKLTQQGELGPVVWTWNTDAAARIWQYLDSHEAFEKGAALSRTKKLLIQTGAALPRN